MTTEESNAAINTAMDVQEAILRQSYTSDTVYLAKLAFANALEMIDLNCHFYDGKEEGGLDPGQVMVVFVSLCATLDRASEHVASIKTGTKNTISNN